MCTLARPLLWNRVLSEVLAGFNLQSAIQPLAARGPFCITAPLSNWHTWKASCLQTSWKLGFSDTPGP